MFTLIILMCGVALGIVFTKLYTYLKHHDSYYLQDLYRLENDNNALQEENNRLAKELHYLLADCQQTTRSNLPD